MGHVASAYVSSPSSNGAFSGTGVDILARLVAPFLQNRFAQPFIVENRPGASGNIGTQAVARAAPDGRELFAPQHRTIVPHTRGFEEVDVRAAFEGAGLVEFEMRDAFVAKMRSTGGETRWFIAKGVKQT